MASGETGSARLARLGLVSHHVPEELETFTTETLHESHTSPPGVVSLADCHAVFRRWFGPAYDLGSLDVIIAAGAVERMGGDPLWVLLVSGSGHTKTETVMPLTGCGALAVSSIASEASLLSGTPKKERETDSTGGLLLEIGPTGVLVIKDVTTILSANRDQRAQVLAALREVFDGRWSRTVGTGGGQTLRWEGRIAIVGAVTTAWDRAHTVVASMGDRFVLVRTDSRKEREVMALQALQNSGQEVRMREELAQAVGGVIAGMSREQVEPTKEERMALVQAANVVTLARTAVEFDYQGNVEMAHAPEAPTRFAKQLLQVFRGAVAVGGNREKALALAIRVARDSMPPLRLAILDDLARYPDSTSGDVYQRIDMPRTTVARQVNALHALGVVMHVGQRQMGSATPWTFALADDIDPAVLRPGLDTTGGV